MRNSLRALNVEDSEQDAALLKRHLISAGYDITSWLRVDKAADMRAALNSQDWDIVLCDYAMPRFDALKALAVLRETGIDIPFIIISGTVGEEVAVKAMLTGAHDYLSKDNLTRLVPAIERELKEAKNRSEFRTVESAHKLSEERYRTLFEYAPDGIIISGPDDYYLDANASMCQMLGYEHKELIGLHAADIVVRSEARKLDSEFALVQNNPDYNREWHFRRKDGSEFPAEVIATIMPDGNLLAMIRDITDRKATEEKLSQIQSNLATAQQIARLGSWEMDLPLKGDEGAGSLRWSDEVFRIFGYEPGEVEVSNENFFLAAHPDDREKIRETMARAIRESKTYSLDHRIILPDGGERIVHEHSEIVFDPKTGEALKMIGTVQDVTDRKEIERKLAETAAGKAESLALIDTILANAPIGFAFHDRELRYVRINETLAAINGSSVESHLGQSLEDMLPEMVAVLGPIMRQVIQTGQPVVDFEFSAEAKAKPGEMKHWLVSFYPVRMEKGEILGVGVLVNEITERKKVEEELRESEERFSGAFEFAPIGVALILSDGRWLKVNRALCHLTGYSESELLNLRFQDITHLDDVNRGVSNWRRLLKGKIAHYQMEKRYVHKLGHIVFVSVNVSLVRDSAGNPLYFISQIQDITARKQAEMALRASEKRYHSLFENMIEGYAYCETIFEGDDLRDFVYTEVNGAFGALTGLKDVAGKKVSDVVPGLAEAHPALFETYGRVALTGIPEKFETYVQPLEIWLSITVYSSSRENFVAVFDNITERKLANAALQESNEKFHQLADNINDAFWIRSPDLQKIYYISPAFEGIWGRPVEAVYAEPTEWLKYILPEDREYVGSAYKGLMGSDPTMDIEYRIVRPDGEIRWLRTRGFQVKDKNGHLIRLAGVVSDITERKAAEKALLESDEKFRQLADNISDAFWIRSPDLAHVYYISPAYEKIWGRTIDSDYANPKKWYDFIVAEDREYVRQAFASLVNDSRDVDIEYRITRPDGEIRWVRARGFPVRSADGEVIRLAGIATDITESRNTQEALKASEERYRSVVDTAPDVIVTIDDSSTISFINPAAEKLFGHTTEEMKGASLTLLMPEYLRHLHESGFKQYQETGVKHLSWDYLEVTGLHKSGQEIPITISFSEFVQNGKRYFTGIIRDISERKQAMAALEESEERNRELVENATDIIYTHDLQGNYTSVNRAGERITGFTAAESLAKNIADTVAPEFVETARRMIAEKLAGNQNTAYEVDLIAKDGHRVSLEVNTRIIFENGIPVGVQGIARDITERKKVQEALTESEERYRELVENAIDVIYTLDLKGNYTSVNRASEELTGFTVEETLKRNIVDSMAPEYRNRAKLLLEAQVYGENLSAFELETVAKDGRRIALEIKTRPIKENGIPVGVQGIARDITERKRFDAALKASEASFKSLFDTANDAIMVLNEGLFIDCNHRTEILFGCTKEDILGRSPMNLSPPVQPDGRTSSDKVTLYITPAMQGIPQFFEWQHVRKDGTLFDAEVSLNRVDFHGETHVQAIVRDITDRKKAEALLIESQEQMKLAAESVNLGIWDWDVVENKLIWDDRMYELYGTNAEDFSGAYEAWQKGLHPDDRQVGDDNIQAALAGERPFNNEFRVIWPNGEIRNIEARAIVKRDAAGNPLRMIGVNWDITKRKDLEEQFRQSQKMEAVGVLAGGIAHDFNNLLTAINGYSALTLKKMPADDPFRHNIEEVKKAGDRAAELTSQLLAFSRKQVLKPVVLNLNLIIHNIENMLRRIIKESVELRVVADPMLGNIRADPGQIEQVIMNLAINARDAMPGGGTLTIETQNVYLDEDYIAHHINVTPGEFIRLTVTDTGQGMSPATQAHIFEPFFTTKDVGKGTGLGLSTVYGIVNQSGGDILVYSELGHGTTFKIHLPCVDEIVHKPRWTGERKQMYVGTETILVVEDEEVVRSLVREILVDNGYTVLEAATGLEALRICKTYTGTIHMLLTDVIMPKMGGSELKDIVVTLRPDIFVIFMSGYTDDSVASRGIFDADIPFIEKPFTPDALARKVREVFEY